MNSQAVFQLDQLQVSHDNLSLFPVVSISVCAGELITIMGPSGCGKSVLLSAIAGSLAAPFRVSGDMYLQDRKINNDPMHTRQIAIAYQEDLLFPHMNVTANLLFALGKGDRMKRIEQVHSALSSAGLENFGERDIATLSGGQKARISLIRSLLAKPKLLLLDEPFSKLDEQLRQAFREFVYSQVKRMDIPALLVTHDQQDCPSEQYYALQSGAFEKKKLI